MTWYLGFTWLFVGIAAIERFAGVPREVWQSDVLVAVGFAVLDAIARKPSVVVQNNITRHDDELEEDAPA